MRTREEKRREENIKPTTSIEAAVVETPARDETDFQRRLRKSCESLHDKITEKWPHTEGCYDVETEKILCFYRDRPSRADPSLAVWKWFERVPQTIQRQGANKTASEIRQEKTRRAAREFAVGRET